MSYRIQSHPGLYLGLSLFQPTINMFNGILWLPIICWEFNVKDGKEYYLPHCVGKPDEIIMPDEFSFKEFMFFKDTVGSLQAVHYPNFTINSSECYHHYDNATMITVANTILSQK